MEEIDTIKINELSKRKVKLRDIAHIDGFLYIILDNGQKILTDGKRIYDLSDYGYVRNILIMGDRLCVSLNNGFGSCLLDLNTKAILFNDDDAYAISKQDDRTIHVIKQIGKGNNTIYDIEKKKYLPMPEGYEFENSLGNGLYVFCEEDVNIPFYEKKRCVINSDLKVVLKDIKGWIYYEEGYLIVHKDKRLSVMEIKGDKVTSIKVIEQNEDILTTPEYYDGKIIIVLKDKINIYKPNLELIKSIEVSGLSEVKDSERIGDILKLCVPTMHNDEVNGRHIFVNVKTGKRIEHLRINGYPYWVQNAFVGQDEFEDYIKLIDYYFYDKDFNLVLKEKGSDVYCADDENESLFIIVCGDKSILINTENGCKKETDYKLVRYSISAPYGYGVNSNDTMDFFDRNLNIIIPNFDYKKYDLGFERGDFSYFIVNRYICITTDFIDDYGREQYRKIIVNSNGEIILDSIKHKCYPIGNYIQIMDGKESQFLNTLTGDIGEMAINCYVDSDGKIDFSKVISFDSCLSIDSGDNGSIKRLVLGS